MKVYIASDHAGFDLKRHLIDYLEGSGVDVVDKGPFDFDPADDYPDWVGRVAEEVSRNPEVRGIVIGMSGQGEAMTVNKYLNVRAAVFYGPPSPSDDPAEKNEPFDPYRIIRLSREHNDSNILSLAAKYVSKKEAEKAVDVWVDTQFSGIERHRRRIEKMNTMGHD